MTQNEIIITLSLIVTQWPFYDGFPAPLAARVSLPFHLHAKRNFEKMKV